MVSVYACADNKTNVIVYMYICSYLITTVIVAYKSWSQSHVSCFTYATCYYFTPTMFLTRCVPAESVCLVFNNPRNQYV